MNETFSLAVGPLRVGPGANVLDLEDAAGFGKGLGDVGLSVVTHHLSARDTQAVELGQCTAQEADRCALLFIGKHLYISEPCGVTNRHVDLGVTYACRAALPLASDAVSHLRGSGPATYTHSAGKSLFLRLVLPGSDFHSDARKSIAAVPSASDGGLLVDVWGVGSRVGGDTATGSVLTHYWRLTNLLRQNR